MLPWAGGDASAARQGKEDGAGGVSQVTGETPSSSRSGIGLCVFSSLTPPQLLARNVLVIVEGNLPQEPCGGCDSPSLLSLISHTRDATWALLCSALRCSLETLQLNRMEVAWSLSWRAGLVGKVLLSSLGRLGLQGYKEKM